MQCCLRLNCAGHCRCRWWLAVTLTLPGEELAPQRLELFKQCILQLIVLQAEGRLGAWQDAPARLLRECHRSLRITPAAPILTA